MALQNSIAPKKAGAPATFSAFLTSEGVRKKINDMVGGQNGQRFITAIISATSVNPDLQKCEHSTILAAAMLGESLGLSPSPQLGHYYMVPYEDKKRGCKVAQFQLGYKGYVQLAERSGYYKKINVLSIKEGELIKYDPLNEEIEVRLIEDDEERENAKTVGYYAMFEYMNGFRKAIYWSKKKMLKHADKYSAAFSLEATNGKYPKVSFADFEAGNFDPKTAWLYSSFWYKDFDGMAHKTMLRQLISKWGIMSIEMQRAFEGDMSMVKEDGSFEYVDNQTDFDTSNVVDVETGEIRGANELTEEEKAEIIAQEQAEAQDDFFSQQ